MEASDCLKVVRRYMPLILSAMVLSALFGWSVSKFILTPKYESKALVVVSTEAESGYLSATRLLGSDTIHLFYNVAESDSVAEKTIQALKLDILPKEMHRIIKTEVDYDTGVMTVLVKAGDASRSKEIIDAYISILGQEVKNVFSDLMIFVVDEPKLPKEPASPKVFVNTALSAVGGVMAAALITIIWSMKLQPHGDMQVFSKFPKLFSMGTMPKLNIRDKKGMYPFSKGKKARDAIRVIGANLQYVIEDRKIKTFVVSSPTSKEGKSTISIYLAANIAQLHHKHVLLVDCNMNNSLYRKLDVAGAFSKMGVKYTTAEYRPNPIPELDIDMIMAPSDQKNIHYEQLRPFLMEMEKRYDLVILDCPCVSDADTITLLNIVKNILIISDYWKLNWRMLKTCLHQLAQINAAVLGIVANRMP